jgi:SAM-dependent methyltransferase
VLLKRYYISDNLDEVQEMTIRGRLFRLSHQCFGKELSLNEFLDEYVAPKRMVIMGEFHGAPPIIQLQTSIQETMARSLEYPKTASSGAQVRVLMEHFSVDMQGILNQYHDGNLDIPGLMHAYDEIGTEGHNLTPYIPALESALHNDRIQLHGGFIPRSYARILMREGLDSAIQAASEAGYIGTNETLAGTDSYYNFFESLLTGRNMHMDPKGDSCTDRFRAKMFPAQIIKDASMAWCVQNLEKDFNITGEDRMLLVCGVGHMLYSHGVPERILAHSNSKDSTVVKSKDDMLRVACLPISKGELFGLELSANDSSGSVHENDTDRILSILKDAYGGAAFDAADVCFLYEEAAENVDDEEDNIRQETQAAYDKVGTTAHLEGGDMKKAHDILTSLNYTSDEIAFAGVDAVNYQGVGCPHRHANIQPGESILDMGSGLGVDSLIATEAVGPQGRVVGVDLSSECVGHANKRALDRRVDNILTFVQSPIESIGSKIDDGEECFDAVISNGAFCLIPNKKSGFAECHRLLKPGGRIAICTTVIKDKLEDGVEWPLCMQTFARIDELEPMLQELGFVDIHIDLSDSLMEVPEPEQEPEENEGDDDDNEKEEEDTTTDAVDGEGRFKVHNEEGRERFRHLENFDMNMLCARVVIKARKL